MQELIKGYSIPVANLLSPVRYEIAACLLHGLRMLLCPCAGFCQVIFGAVVDVIVHHIDVFPLSVYVDHVAVVIDMVVVDGDLQSVRIAENVEHAGIYIA